MTDIDPNADLKAKAAQATAEAALATAQAQLIKAQAELAAANQPPDPLIAVAADLKAKTAQATAETSLVTAKAQLAKAQAELVTANQPPDPLIAAATAEKARLDAQKAVAQAAIGLVTGSTAFTGAVEVKGDAGKGEATLLASRAIKCAAATIAKAIRSELKPEKSVVLMQGAEAPQFANYRQFLLQESLIAQIFTAAENEATRLSDEADKLTKPAPAAPPSVLPALSAADVVLNAVTKLGSYFMSNYEIGGITLTPDGEQLVSAVANQLVGSATLVLPARAVPQADDFADMMKTIAAATIQADSHATELSANAEDAKAQAESAPAGVKEKLLRGAELYEQGAAVLRKAITKSEEFISALSVADAKGVAPITKIALEKAICDELKGEEALALVLDVRAMVGGYYTKKNLFTFLGGMPFYVMGGAVVTYYLVDKKGKVKKAGLVPVHGGYAPVQEVVHMIR
jgi:hypothetical protein